MRAWRQPAHNRNSNWFVVTKTKTILNKAIQARLRRNHVNVFWRIAAVECELLPRIGYDNLFGQRLFPNIFAPNNLFDGRASSGHFEILRSRRSSAMLQPLVDSL